MFGTPVPEAAVDEDGETFACEHDIRSAATVYRQRKVDPVPEAEAPQRATHSQLRTGVGLRLPCETLRRLGVPGKRPVDSAILSR